MTEMNPYLDDPSEYLDAPDAYLDATDLELPVEADPPVLRLDPVPAAPLDPDA